MRAITRNQNELNQLLPVVAQVKESLIDFILLLLFLRPGHRAFHAPRTAGQERAAPHLEGAATAEKERMRACPPKTKVMQKREMKGLVSET